MIMMPWKADTFAAAKMLFELGLLRFPPLPVIIDLCASQDPNVRPNRKLDLLPLNLVIIGSRDCIEIPLRQHKHTLCRLST